MSKGMATNEALEAIRGTTVRRTDDGHLTVEYAEDEPVTHQQDPGQIPKREITGEMLADSGDDPKSWLMYGNGYRQQRFTGADVITPDNVGDLELEYTIETQSKGTLEGTPIVVPTDPPIMYQTNGPDALRAVNARSGEVLWTYTYQNKQGGPALLCCGNNNRGVAVWKDTLYMTTLDANVVAIDRYSGEQKWSYDSAPTEQGYSATWAPIVYDGMILNGSAGGEYGMRGFIEAVDAEKGERVWRTWMTPKDQWIGDSWKHGASPNWMSVTVDGNTDTLYAGIGNAGPDVNGIVRPGPNVYSTAVVALDIGSGEENWYFQESPHGWWDWDAASPPVLFDADVDGETQTVVTQAGKTGWLYLLGAGDGKLHERSAEFCQHLNMWNLPQKTLKDSPWVMPSADGGSEWNPTSYSRETGLVYVKSMNYPSKFQWDEANYTGTGTYLAGLFTVLPEMQDHEPKPKEWNEKLCLFSAVDPVSGDVVWQDEIDQYGIGGSMSTATGLTFAGFGDGQFVAYDSASGTRLWTHEFDASVNGSPMGWYDPGTQKQYVAVQAGGGGLRSVTDGKTVGVFSMKR